MDSTLYKDITTTRGLKYHYYFSPPQDNKATVIFCHGFPSTSQDWHSLAAYFQKQGLGVIAPDMLGYGGTDKPTDPAVYRQSLISKDLIDILDAEKVDRAIAIGHDWGSRVVSRLANFFPERFLAFAFLAVPYMSVNPTSTVEQLLKFSKERFGYELFGYWLFFSEEGADKIIENHWDSFFGLLYPHDPTLWKTYLGPVGEAKAAVLSDTKRPLPSYLSEEDKKAFSDVLLKGGMAAPLCWYRVITSGISADDDASIPESRYFPPVSTPLFFAAANKDAICLAAMGKAAFASEALKDHDITIKEYDADHWLIFSHRDELNRDLGAWVEKVVASTSKAQL